MRRCGRWIIQRKGSVDDAAVASAKPLDSVTASSVVARNPRGCTCDDDGCETRWAVWDDTTMGAIVKESTIPGAGMGLFAERAYSKGEMVVHYSGTYRDDPTAEGDRVIQIDRKWSVDADGPCTHPRNRGDLVNHGGKLNSNCKYAFFKSPRLRMVCVVATRDIQEGEEFLADYGPWFAFR